MIFPIGDDQVKGGATPYVSYGLIVLNVIIFIVQYLTMMSKGPEWLGWYYTEFGAIPYEISHGEDLFTLVTSIFMHGGFLHLLGNMVFLWVFADNLESNIGSINFLVYYLLGGLAASLLQVYIDPASMVPGIGASGAIAATLGTYLIIYPKSQIKIFVFLIVFVKTFRIPAALFLIIWIAQQLFAGFGSLQPSSGDGGGVAWWAHIGGFVFGLLFGLILRQFGSIMALEGKKKV